MADKYGVRRGDIRNREYAWKAKTYSWGALDGLMPRGISPTDIDGLYELNTHFLYVEFKTVGSAMPKGQRMMFERKLNRDKSKGALFVIEHNKLETVGVSEFLSIAVHRYDECTRKIQGTQQMPIKETEDVAWWFREWRNHAEDKLSHFVTRFRVESGIIPPTRRWQPEQ